jgi:hypothetical protein
LVVASILIFLGFIAMIVIFKKYILENIIPKIFSFGFLLIGFLVVGVVFSILYFIVDYLVNDNLFKIDFYSDDVLLMVLNYLYFSFISQLTIGYGDIHPIHPLGKSLSMIQGFIGAIFMGGLVATLIGNGSLPPPLLQLTTV